MSAPPAAHPGRHEAATQPSLLRNEVPLESDDNARSEVQVPDSQGYVPETQYDPQHASDHLEPGRECAVGRENPRQPITADGVVQKRRPALKKNVPPAEPITTMALQKPPEPKSIAAFTPFSKPNFHGKPKQKPEFQLTAKAVSSTFPKPCSPELHSASSQKISKAPTKRKRS